MDLIEGLALGLFAILVALLVVVARRMGRLIASTRADDVFRRSIADLVRRADAALAEVAVGLDDVRYRHAAPDAIGGQVDRADRAIEALTAEARALPVGPDHIGFRNALVGELVRAGAALGAIADAIGDLPDAPASAQDGAAPPGAVLTTVKRGYLAVTHAREAMGDLALRSGRMVGSGGGPVSARDGPATDAR